MSARRLQREWQQIQLSHPANLVFFKQYKLQLEQAERDHPGWSQNPTVNDNIPPLTTLSLAPSVASVFPTQDLIIFPINLALTHWVAYINGPSDTPYDSFRFELRIEIPANFPYSPPQIAFITPIFHPNIDFDSGEICLDMLKENWTPTWTLEASIRAIGVLLSEPEHSSPLNIDAANILRSGDQRGYWSIARMQTINYAIPLPQIQQQPKVKEKEAKEDVVVPNSTTTTTTTTTPTTSPLPVDLDNIEIPATPADVDPELARTQPDPNELEILDATTSKFDDDSEE